MGQFVETGSRSNAEWDMGVCEGHLRIDRIEVGSVEDGDLIGRRTGVEVVSDDIDDFFGLRFSFRDMKEGRAIGLGVGVVSDGAELLVELFCVMEDRGVGEFEDWGAGAVVALEFHDLCIGVSGCEIHDIAVV